jgi:DHA1 family inner membrane transport protein
VLQCRGASTRFLPSTFRPALFGVGAVVAASVVEPARKGSAIALMFAGLTLANVIGVPFGAAMGHWGG